jgi:hypothetical protein
MKSTQIPHYLHITSRMTLASLCIIVPTAIVCVVIALLWNR